jgi:hypothetical protein
VYAATKAGEKRRQEARGREESWIQKPKKRKISDEWRSRN